MLSTLSWTTKRLLNLRCRRAANRLALHLNIQQSEKNVNVRGEFRRRLLSQLSSPGTNQSTLGTIRLQSSLGQLANVVAKVVPMQSAPQERFLILKDFVAGTRAAQRIRSIVVPNRRRAAVSFPVTCTSAERDALPWEHQTLMLNPAVLGAAIILRCSRSAGTGNAKDHGEIALLTMFLAMESLLFASILATTAPVKSGKVTSILKWVLLVELPLSLA